LVVGERHGDNLGDYKENTKVSGM